MVSFWIRDEKRDEAFLYTPWPAMMLLNQRQAGRHGFTKRKRFYGVGMHQSGFSLFGGRLGFNRPAFICKRSQLSSHRRCPVTERLVSVLRSVMVFCLGRMMIEDGKDHGAY